MTDDEREILLKSIIKRGEEFKRNPQARIDFYKEMGVLTKKGKLSKHYKYLCIKLD